LHLGFDRGIVTAMGPVTQILSAIEQGDPQASQDLLPLVYDELRKLAAHRLNQEKPGQTLAATALVHEAYLRLVGSEPAGHWNGRGHFFAAAAEAMRRILIESARRKARLKRGGDIQRIELPDPPADSESSQIDLLALNEALEALETERPDLAQIVKLRFFAGCALEETAELLGISRATAQRKWVYARTWLYGRMKES
jgi:RNA polymerase sigma factor (TIGR02999 family)